MKLHGPDEPVYTIGVAARLLGVSTQTLRILDREGLVEPSRTDANIRLYSENDLLLLKKITSLVKQKKVNIAGVKMILKMESTDEDGNLHYTHLEVHHRQLVPVEDMAADEENIQSEGRKVLNSTSDKQEGN